MSRALKNKTLAYTFLPSFYNANGRLCQEIKKLLWRHTFSAPFCWKVIEW